jgi:hypothetical protein
MPFTSIGPVWKNTPASTERSPCNVFLGPDNNSQSRPNGAILLRYKLHYANTENLIYIHSMERVYPMSENLLTEPNGAQTMLTSCQDQVKDKIQSQVKDSGWSKVMRRTGASCRSHLWGHVSIQISAQVWFQVTANILKKIRNQPC